MSEASKNKNYTGIALMDLTTGLLNESAQIEENKGTLVHGVKGIITGYYFAFDSMPEYAEWKKNKDAKKAEVNLETLNKRDLEQKAVEQKAAMEAVDLNLAEVKPGFLSRLWILFLILTVVFWLGAAVLQFRYRFDLFNQNGISQLLRYLPMPLIFPQTVFARFAEMNPVQWAVFLSSEAMQYVILIMPFVFVIWLIAAAVKLSKKKKKAQEELNERIAQHKKLGDDLSNTERELIASNEKLSTLLSEQNDLEFGSGVPNPKQFHKYAEKYRRLKKYRTMIPKKHRNAHSLAVMTKVLSYNACTTWKEVLDICDKELEKDCLDELSENELQRISFTFSDDRFIKHLMNAAQKTDELKEVDDLWHVNSKVNEEYITDEEALQKHLRETQG